MYTYFCERKFAWHYSNFDESVLLGAKWKLGVWWPDRLFQFLAIAILLLERDLNGIFY